MAITTQDEALEELTLGRSFRSKGSVWRIIQDAEPGPTPNSVTVRVDEVAEPLTVDIGEIADVRDA